MFGQRTLTQQVHHVGAEKCGGHGPVTEIANDVGVDGLSTPMDRDAGWLHKERGHEVRGDRGRRRHAEEKDQHRCHQRTAAHAGQANQESHHGTTQDEEDVNVHETTPLERYLVIK
jgi:hypothetical protein